MREFGCLREFKHPDFVTSVRFHPSAPGLFLTGCADGRVRLWDCAAPAASAAAAPPAGCPGTAGGGGGGGSLVASAAVQQDMVTAVDFMPDGRSLVIGTLRGVLR